MQRRTWGWERRRQGSFRPKGRQFTRTRIVFWSLTLRSLTLVEFKSDLQRMIDFSGAPPAYPGLANHHVPNSVHPPAYSPSHVNPPAYSPGFTKNFYRSNQNAYGSQFGKSGLSGNTYIANNYYGVSSYGRYRSSGSSFLTNALFFGVGMRHGHYLGNANSNDRNWNSDDDYRWRETTKAPYFENKAPGSESK